jgi:bacterioferritin-associated ferredoxin
MTDHEAKHLLDRNTLMFNFFEQNQSVPDRTHGAIEEVYQAYKHFNPSFVLDSCCGSCVMNMIESANAKRKELNLKFHTFPKQD